MTTSDAARVGIVVSVVGLCLGFLIGVGLAVCRKIVEAHGGAIVAAPAPEHQPRYALAGLM